MVSKAALIVLALVLASPATESVEYFKGPCIDDVGTVYVDGDSFKDGCSTCYCSVNVATCSTIPRPIALGCKTIFNKVTCDYDLVSEVDEVTPCPKSSVVANIG